MSVSKHSARAAAAMGEHVGARHYVAKLVCPVCAKRYAKRQLWLDHIAKHRAAK